MPNCLKRKKAPESRPLRGFRFCVQHGNLFLFA
nr:MAG TPA: hypothetical protein [Caudoviricetes sp.]DAV53783.1 MAG TPA: hypothetical protein [Caudoviricetes sp.]